MANYYGTWRSNYFRVKDKDAFLNALSNIPDVSVIFEPKMQKDGAAVEHCFLHCAYSADSGGIPWQRYDDAKDDYVDIEWQRIFAEHLQEHSVAIFMEAGAEKIRYVVGIAHAFNSSGEMITISLDDIYKKAQEVFGDEATIELAQY